MYTAGNRRRRRGERGNALILALLILFAMLGLGLLAMRSTTENIASTGNLRLTKQARYVAEMGMYHAVSLLQAESAALLALRDQPRSRLEIDSAGGVRVRHADGSPGPQAVRPVPALFTAVAGGPVPPPALGQFGQGAGLVPSYRVEVDGFVPAPPQPGYGIDELRKNKETFCLMQFTARGFVADVALPDQARFERVNRESVFSEFNLKAAVVLGPVAVNLCSRT